MNQRSPGPLSLDEFDRLALTLKNPHSVLAALQTRAEGVFEVRSHTEHPGGVWDDVLRTAGEKGVPVRRGAGRSDGGRRQRRSQPDQPGRVGAAEATVAERADLPLETLFKDADQGGPPRLWIALDRLQDPHNVGAIFRAAAFFGVAGIVLSRDKSAPLNATVYDVASGGLEYVPFSVQTNLSRALDAAKELGVWVLGTSEHAQADVLDVDRGRPWLLVLGNEEKGLRHLTLEKCDEVCRLTPRGALKSLNVSVATGCLLTALTLRDR